MKATPVKINGEVYPVKYGFAALRAFSDVTNTKLSEMDSLGSNMTFTQAIALVWAGMKDGARVSKEGFALDLDDVADLLDEDEKALERVLKVFSDNLSKNSEPANGQRATKKK
tara:strand:- start:954 stop:1292 length:339 start_codon:yes stop_codon:yes gene_type:complete